MQQLTNTVMYAFKLTKLLQLHAHYSSNSASMIGYKIFDNLSTETIIHNN